MVTLSPSPSVPVASLDAVPAMAWVAGPGRTCIATNRAWEAFTGRPAAQDVGSGWQQLVHPEDAAAWREAAARAGDAGFTLEFRLRRHDGVYRLVEEVAGERGAGGARFGIVRDIQDGRERDAELHAALERLRDAEKARGMFLNAASHELRTPLTPLLMQLQMMLANPQAAPLADGLRIALRSAERLHALVTDLLNVGRLQSAGMDLQPDRTDLRGLVTEVARSFAVAATVKGITLAVEPGPAVEAVVDSRRMGQVVANLLSNAIRFTPRGGTILVAAEADEGAARVWVQDSGIGIPPGRQPELFKPFSQVHSARLDTGSGLGLFISRSIVEAHGGTIAVSSEGEGRGSRFTVTLPKEPVPAPAAPNPG